MSLDKIRRSIILYITINMKTTNRMKFMQYRLGAANVTRIFIVPNEPGIRSVYSPPFLLVFYHINVEMGMEMDDILMETAFMRNLLNA